MEPVPRPASLEKIPRDTPFFMLSEEASYHTAGHSMRAEKHHQIIEAKTCGIRSEVDAVQHQGPEGYKTVP